MFNVAPWEFDQQTGEALRDFEIDGGLFAAMVTLDEQITGEPPRDPARPWHWSATRHDDDPRDERRERDEEHEWIKEGFAATREEGMELADKVLRDEGYTLQ